ncbi:methyltransferase domain-containing protein [Pseudofrankia sp. BMG5.37]|nr:MULTISPECIES: methyltransferase domain-containing protein [unclassified Pseudofrankia]MDT3443175.1 methyltransferase domain-containing protein [Pseudofrankia sp. BMG5.37]
MLSGPAWRPVTVKPPPAGGFDLVHARLLLTHVPRRVEALASMVRALRPGGWLVIEDADPALQPLVCLDEYGPAQELANRLRQGFRTLMAGRGAELAFGRTLPRLLRGAGLDAVRADAFFPVTSPACSVLEIATVQQIRGRLLAAGLATETEIEEHLANVASGRLDLATAPLISAWGASRGSPGGPARSGLSVPWSDERRSIIELADACDVPTRWSCRTGVCHTCVTLLLTGSVRYAPTPWSRRPPARC